MSNVLILKGLFLSFFIFLSIVSPFYYFFSKKKRWIVLMFLGQAATVTIIFMLLNK